MIKQELKNIEMAIEEIYTKNVAFRPLSKSDAFPLFNATKNSEFNKYLAWKQPNDEKEVIEQVLYLLREQRVGEVVLQSMIEKTTGKWMGLIKYSIYKDSIMVSLWCHPDYWGSRNLIIGILGTFDVVFRESNINKIYLKHHIEYEKMEKIALGVNFSYLYNEAFITPEGEEIMCKTYSLLKENYKKITTIYEY